MFRYYHFSSYRRVSSCAPNARFMKSRSVAVSREMIHGITLEAPSGIGGTAFGCAVIAMLSLSPQRVELTLPLFEPGRFALLHDGIGVPVDDLPVTIFPAINLRDA